MKILLFLIILSASSAFASSESATVDCTARISKVGYFGVDYFSRDLTKSLEVKKSYINTLTKSVQMSEVVNFSMDYSVSIELKETMNLLTGKVEATLNGKIFRHRVGNGKILLGENSRVLNFDRRSFGGYINVRIENKFNSLISFQNQGVVKDAFIECSTL